MDYPGGVGRLQRRRLDATPSHRPQPRVLPDPLGQPLAGDVLLTMNTRLPLAEFVLAQMLDGPGRGSLASL